MKKNILVTGAAGFIGYHLAKRLHARGDHVIGYDNFNLFYDPQLKRGRADDLQIEVINSDICDYDRLNNTVQKHNITHIAHLAAQAGVRHSIEHPHEYIKSNVEGFLNILEVCRHNPSIKLTYASSSSVYGLNDKTPFSIEDRTDKQASMYGASKKANELMAYTYHHLYGIPVTGLRFFTVYGPWGRPDMAYFSFTKAIIEEQPIDIYNQGDMNRDFTYVDDIVEGTVAAIDLGAEHEIFNLGNHEPVELLEFVRMLENTIGKKAEKNFLPMQKGDVPTTYADIEHSRKMLGYAPKTDLQDGLDRFVDWYKNFYHGRK